MSSATLSSFSVDRARALDGPEVLVDQRIEAAERLAAAPAPTTDEEVWRYSRIGELDLDRFARAVDTRPPRVRAPTVAGLTVATVSEGGSPDLPVGDEPHYFELLNRAFAADPLVIRVADGVQVPEPVVVTDLLDADAGSSFGRVVVSLGSDASLDLVLVERDDDNVGLSVPSVSLRLGPASRLNCLVRQELGPQAWRIASHTAEVGQDATLVLGEAGLGGDYARTRTDCRLVGRGATGNLRAAYFGAGSQMLDFRTFQYHVAPDTSSDLLFKGALAGRSSSVYTGLIKVGPGARGTNAFQTNRNIKLSDDAWAESVPNLEIENNDVHCSHASTVSPVDPDQLFYLESRGVPPDAAERLIVAGFFDEVLQRLPVHAEESEIRERFRARLAEVEG